MKYNTAGNKIYEPIYTCNCGLTGGCNYCRPSFVGCINNEEADIMKRKIKEWKIRFNEDFENKAMELEKLLKE